MGLSLVVALFGPPAAGKTTLTTLLGGAPGRRVFRLREHVPREVLAATATDSRRLGWIDDYTVSAALRALFTATAEDPHLHTVLLDNFPGAARQVDQLLTEQRALFPEARVEAVEVSTDAKTLQQRAKNRKVCHRCEPDPIGDPRLPAIPRADDPWACARCGGLLHPRRGDAPRLLKARIRRYQHAAEGVRAAFVDSGVPVTQLDTTTSVNGAANLLAPLLISRSVAR
ncbi:ATP-binding protein [Nocardia cyriacigeorgica]|uniref:Adenylate kinase n=1 Tax=Nocardia cyriacigeorgica TaxID=135487 RepID=A0A5R8NAJ5_9NOCA|nr:ATP-binding protein [Nocardia cyriacigeorgica]MBF6093966.1 hypothetical protein [Nocardia cyriacigeorgica]TLF72714.1 ATP-binding protein [Nocardia cyriacigeorgica]TLG12468.1 ATP-binding protein [Nocardia cyriacigeorgica]